MEMDSAIQIEIEKEIEKIDLCIDRQIFDRQRQVAIEKNRDGSK